jgi:hypothetical protein
MADETNPSPAPAAPPPAQTALPLAPPAAVRPGEREVIPPALMGEIQRLQQERDAARAELDKLSKAGEETKATVAKLTEQVQLTEKQRAEIESQRKADRVREAVRVAAIKHDAVSEAQVLKLLDGELVLDEQGAVVAKSDPKLGAEDYMKKFLADNPHLRQSRAASGSGASPFPAQSAPQAMRVDLSTNEGLTAYARMLTQPRQPAAATTNPGAPPGGPARGV